MTPQRLVRKLADAGYTFKVVADDSGGNKLKVTEVIGDYRYTFRFTEADDTECVLLIKHRTMQADHRSKQRTKKALGMVLQHLQVPTFAFKLLYKAQEAGD